MTKPTSDSAGARSTASHISESKSATIRPQDLTLTRRVSDLLLSDDLKLEDAITKVAYLIPEYLPHPSHLGTRIRVQDTETKTDRFDPDQVTIECPITLNDKAVGSISVSYDHEIPDNPTFTLDKELVLLETIAAVIELYLKFHNARAIVGNARERLALLDDLMGKSPAIAFVWDLNNDTSQVYVSGNIEQFGYLPIDFESKRLIYQDIIHPDDLIRVDDELELFFKEESLSIIQQFRIMTKQGEVRWARTWTYISRDIEGFAEWAQTIVLDITETVVVENQARRYLEATNNIFLVVDKDGLVLDVNTRLCKLVGVPRDEIIGSLWIKKFVPEASRSAVLNYFKEVIEKRPEGQLRHINDIVSASGEIRTIDCSHSLEFDDSGEVISSVNFGIDVTQRQIERTELAGLKQVLMDNPNPVFRINQTGGLVLANTAGNLIIQNVADRYSDSRVGWKEVVDFALSLDQERSMEVAIDGNHYLFLAVPDAATGFVDIYGMNKSKQRELDSRLQRISETLSGALFDYVMLEDGSDRIDYISPGCLDVWEVPANEIQGNPAKLWDMIHPDDAVAMQNSVLASRDHLTNWIQEWRIIPASGKVKWLRGRGSPVRHTDGSTSWTTIILDITTEKSAKASVETTLRQTVHALSAAVETRDPYTAGHQDNVTLICMTIGQEMGLDAKTMSGLELAANVRDIGKIQIPAEILSKPGRLTEIEFEMIKTHPVTGSELLKNVDFTWPIADIVRQHHERIDGSGYPDGLVGDQILMEARVVAVADVMEAMASHRPYRAALGIDAALEELRAGSGTRYDPTVVAAAENQIDAIKMVLRIADT